MFLTVGKAWKINSLIIPHSFSSMAIDFINPSWRLICLWFQSKRDFAFSNNTILLFFQNLDLKFQFLEDKKYWQIIIIIYLLLFFFMGLKYQSTTCLTKNQSKKSWRFDMTTGKTLDVSYLVWLIFNGKWNRSFISLSSLDKKEYYKLITQMEEWDWHMWNLVDHCNSKVLAKSYNVKKYRCPWIIGTPI